MSIQSFDKSNLVTIRQELNEALAAVVARHPGMKLQLGNITFAPDNFRVTVTASLEDAERKAFEQQAARSNLDITIEHRGHRLVGFRPRTTKCWITEKDGKKYVWANADVVKIWARTRVAA